MEWIVKIENISNQRILVRFDPLNEKIIFVGQFKPHNKQWVDFTEQSYQFKIEPVEEISLENIQNFLKNTYDLMKKRLEVYNNVEEGFSVINLIEIKED